ncbi:MAG: RIP metalloprotease RseP [Gemmatimonadota bacterium]
MLTLLAFLVVIGVLVFVHELGHFLAAKAFGIYVHRFSLGIGAPIKWLTFKRGPTEYSISWLPLGGYVKMASRDEESVSVALEGTASNDAVPPDQVFEAKPVWVRMIVILAGVTLNFAFAVLLYAALIYSGGEPVIVGTTVGRVVTAGLPPGVRSVAQLQSGDEIVRVQGDTVSTWAGVRDKWLAAPGDSLVLELRGGNHVVLPIPRGSPDRAAAFQAFRPFTAPVIGDVLPDKPGAKAGILPGDTIVSVDGVPVAQWMDVVEKVETQAGHPVTLEIGRKGGRRTVVVTPLPETIADGDSTRTVGRIGMAASQVVLRRPVGLGRALTEGFQQTVFMARSVVGLVRGIFAGRVSTREIGGPIAIGMAAGASAKVGAESFFLLMAALSVNLAVLNLLPIPVLDGGQFLFLLGEAILRRPLSHKLRERLTMVGLALLLMIMVLAFSNDFRRLLGI